MRNQCFVRLNPRNMNCLLLTLLVVIQITPSITILDCEYISANNSGVSSGQPTALSSGSGNSFPYCPCPLNTAIAILGYSPCSIHNFISPRECDAFIQVALQHAFYSGLLGRVDLPLFSNNCFSPIPFNENEVSFFNQTQLSLIIDRVRIPLPQSHTLSYMNLFSCF